MAGPLRNYLAAVGQALSSEDDGSSLESLLRLEKSHCPGGAAIVTAVQAVCIVEVIACLLTLAQHGEIARCRVRAPSGSRTTASTACVSLAPVSEYEVNELHYSC